MAPVRIKKCVLALAVVLLTAKTFAQLPIDGIHYPAGLNGIKAGIPSQPGIYLRDDNLIYTACGYQIGELNTLVYLQAPQFMWVSRWKILGAHIGADAMVPFIYRKTDTRISGGATPGGSFEEGPLASHIQSGLGDIKIEPLLLAWHWTQCDLMAAGAVWAPTGNFSVTSPNNLGDDEWSPMISLGAVWYPDQKKTWSLSILHHYELNSSQLGTVFGGLAPGGGFSFLGYKKISCSTYTLECAVGKTIFSHIDAGLAGYYQQQFTDDSVAANPNKDSNVAGAGPEISVLIPRWNLSCSLRYAYEFLAHDRPRGNTIDLAVTKRF